MKTVQYRLRQDLKRMMQFYMDCYSGDILCIDDAFVLMREYDFVDEDGEEVYNGEDY